MHFFYTKLISFAFTDGGGKKEGKLWRFYVFPRVFPTNEEAMKNGEICDVLFQKSSATNIQVMAELRDPERYILKRLFEAFRFTNY